MRPGYRDRFDKDRYVRRGDWLVPREEMGAAEREMGSWPEGRQARDKLSRAPIEPNYEEWKENSRGFDYPGVDTPNDHPREGLLDAYWETRIERRRHPDDALLVPAGVEPWRGSELLGGLAESGSPDDTLRTVLDALRL